MLLWSLHPPWRTDGSMIKDWMVDLLKMTRQSAGTRREEMTHFIQYAHFGFCLFLWLILRAPLICHFFVVFKLHHLWQSKKVGNVQLEVAGSLE